MSNLKAGKSPGVHNIPSELLKNGGETTTVLIVICQKMWEVKKWPKEWTQSLVIPSPQKGHLKQYKNYCIISLISHLTCSELSSTDSRPRLRNCWQKNKQVLNQARAQNRSSIVESS